MTVRPKRVAEGQRGRKAAVSWKPGSRERQEETVWKVSPCQALVHWLNSSDLASQSTTMVICSTPCHTHVPHALPLGAWGLNHGKDFWENCKLTTIHDLKYLLSSGHTTSRTAWQIQMSDIHCSSFGEDYRIELQKYTINILNTFEKNSHLADNSKC